MELIREGEMMKEQGSRAFSKLSKLMLSCFLISLLLIPCSVKCQTWDEIFKQKETQKKYLIEQIAALKIYAGYLRKGYDIAGTGLQTIKDISTGEFNLHGSFISSLKTANPSIRNDVRVAGIIMFQLEIRNAFKSTREGDNLSASNTDYIESVRDKVVGECAGDLEELLLVVTSGKIEMTEGERVQRLEKIHESMRDKSAFTQSFCNKVNLLIRQREKEIRSINQMKHSYGID